MISAHAYQNIRQIYREIQSGIINFPFVSEIVVDWIEL